MSELVSSPVAKVIPPKQREGRLKADRRKLIEEAVGYYLSGMTAFEAALACGYRKEYAANEGVELLQSGYALRLINAAKKKTPDAESLRNMLINDVAESGLRSFETTDKVAALNQLSKVHGWHAPTKTETEVKGGGQVMVVPATVPVDQWEQFAIEQQRQLKTDSSGGE